MTDASLWIRLLQQVKHVVHEVVLVRIFLVFYCHIQRIFKYLYNISPISSGNEVERNSELFHELILPLRGSLINIDLICNDDARNGRTMVPHLLVPVLQVLVGNPSVGVKNQNAAVGTEVVRGVQLVEGLLACGVPDVDLQLLSLVGRVVTVHRQSVGRGGSLFVVVQQESLHQL